MIERKPLIAAFILTSFSVLTLTSASWGQSLEDFENKVTEFTLDNGLHFIVVVTNGIGLLRIWTLWG